MDTIYTPTHLPGGGTNAWGGQRDDAEPTDGLPTLVPGQDALPSSCPHCGSSLLGHEPQQGAHIRGRLVCEMCSRQLCWLAQPPGRGRFALGGLGPRCHAPPTAAELDEPAGDAQLDIPSWRRPGCGDGCVRVLSPLMGSLAHGWIEAHDPDAHEDYIRRLLTPRVVRTGLLVVDLDQHRAWVDGAEVAVSIRRWRALACLAERMGWVVPPPELLGAIDPALVGASHENYLRTLMGNLRARLGAAGRLIETRQDLGYTLRVEPF